MTIPQRILWHVAFGAGLAIAVATTVTYGIVYRAATARELKHLETYLTERARREELGFRQVEANLVLVRGLFLKRNEAPIPGNFEAQWNERFALFPDGSWRSRTNFADGRRHSTLWAHRSVVFTPELKTRVLRAQNICNDLLPGWVDAFPSVYFVMPGWLNIGFDPRLPSWVWDTPADYDPSALEWFQLSMPTNRPAGGIAWSGVIEEPTSKVPIVSVYLPIERNGEFLGSVGHDLFVNRLMEETTRSGLPGATHVIFRRDGRLIAHPTKRHEILASSGRLRMPDCGEPAMASLYRLIGERGERQFSGYDADSRLYFCVARLAGPEWFFLATMPREQLRQQAFQSAQWVVWSGLASLALLLGLLATTLRRQIAHPLAELTRATRQMGGGDTSARAFVARADEFGALARSFNEMGQRVSERDAALRAEKATLERRVAERTAELARFASIAEATGDFFGFADMEERLLYINPAGRRLIGLRPDAPLESLMIRDVHTAGAYEELRRVAIPTALRDGACSGESKLLHRDGHAIAVSLMLVIPRGSDGEPMFVSAIMHDITARKEAEARLIESERQLRESEAWMRALYEGVSAAVVVQDERGFVQINPASLKLFGATRPEEILGRHPADFSPPRQPDGEESATAARRHIERARARGVERFHWQARRLDGTEFPVEVTLTALQLGGRPVLQAVIIDLTERRRAEAELLKTLERERELGELKSNFVSLVSHEFRTPLEIIMSSVDNLDRYHDRLPPEKRQQLLRTIHKAVRRMAGMMEEVLVLGRLETDRMTFQPTGLDLPSFCRRLGDEIESATGGRCPVRLQVAETIRSATGDESLLRHIFTNLLSNAVKYSPPGRPVEFAVERAGNRAICRVTDHGCGIPGDDQKRLFQAFHRGSNVQQIPGTGLGLLIVRRCVELHGGEIRFVSVEGQGTTFTVELPLFIQPVEPALPK